MGRRGGEGGWPLSSMCRSYQVSLETTRMFSHISKPAVTYYYLVRPFLLLLLLSAGGLHILKRSGSTFSCCGVQLFCLLASALSATGRRFVLLSSHPRQAIKHTCRQTGRHGFSFFFFTCDNGSVFCTTHKFSKAVSVVLFSSFSSEILVKYIHELLGSYRFGRAIISFE